jgi:hypothetical protein
MVQQIEIILKPKRRGFHLVTSEICNYGGSRQLVVTIIGE